MLAVPEYYAQARQRARTRHSGAGFRVPVWRTQGKTGPGCGVELLVDSTARVRRCL